MDGLPAPATTETIEGLKCLKRLQPMLARLHGASCERDKAGNRTLFYDDACNLVLLTLFNPTLTSLRDLERASRLQQVQAKLGVAGTSIGSLSESLSLFDPAPLMDIIQELLAEIPDSPNAARELKNLPHVPTAVDGTILLRLPQITEACFSSRNDKGWKLHTHFEILRGIPVWARVTDASGKGEASETAVLRSAVEADRCYITDRGYESFELFNTIAKAESSYVCRVKNNHHFTVEEHRELSAEAVLAGIREDAVGRMGSPNSVRIEHPDHTQRRIVFPVEPHPKRGGRRRKGATQDIVLITNLLDVPPEILILLYKYRWLIELFFRWLKCVFSCRHLLSRSKNGIATQMYCALIAFLLIQLAIGKHVKPTQWTFKLLCLVEQGWATEEEFLAHVEELTAAAHKKIS